MIKKSNCKIIVLNLHDLGCSQRCLFCKTYKFIDKKKARLIAEEQLIKLERFCDKEKSEPNLIIISGNDPGEYFGLFDFLKSIKKITGANVSLQSNGLAFADMRFVKKILSIDGVQSFQIPIYGHKPAIHDAITQKGGSFKKIMRALDNFKKIGFTEISLHTLFLKQNENFLLELFRFLLKFNFSTNASLVCLPSYRGKYDASILRTVPDLNKIRDFFIREAKIISKFNDRLFFYDLPYCLAIGAKNISFFENISESGYEHFKKMKVDIKKNRQRVVASYRLLKKMPICKRCLLTDRCQGITKPYVDLSLFQPKTIKRYFDKFIQK